MSAKRSSAEFDPVFKKALKEIAGWYSSLHRYKHKMPARGTLAAALVVLERLKKNYQLHLEGHRAEGQGQLSGVSSGAVQRVLAQFGETRRFLEEGGRTNRGAPADVAAMLQVLEKCELDRLSDEQRASVLSALQSFLVGKVQEFHARQRLKPSFDPGKTAWEFVHEMIGLAKAEGKDAAVAQYLLGAKLATRFPSLRIRNESFSTADQQRDQHGDFRLGDTVFHVSVHPNPGHYEKCRANLKQGLKPYLVVPHAIAQGAKQITDDMEPGRISVTSIESFVSQNLDELATFAGKGLLKGLRVLLEVYNSRVDEVETDKALLVEIPTNL